MGRAVLVIGATSAIAQATSRRLAAQGDRLYLVARDAAGLAEVATPLGSAVVGTACHDLTDYAAHPGLVEAATAALGGIDIALVCHGWLPDQRETEVTWSVAEQTLAVNLSSVISLLVPLSNQMEAAGHGTLAVITSVAGMRGRPRNYTYGAAKGGLQIYLMGLRSRLYPSGVRVVDLRVGPTDSPMTVGHPRNLLFASPDRVARGIVFAMKWRTGIAYLPVYWWPIMQIVVRLPEPVFQRFGFLADR